jgi:RimJ/RimL family protein N-acetyltransferase
MLRLRHATIEDAEMLLEWRNDPATREASHNTRLVPMSVHLSWLEKSLKNPNRKLYIALQDENPIGTVRIDYINGMHELSWTVAPSARGSRAGKRMVSAVATTIRGSIFAQIKCGNVASIHIAEAAGMKLLWERDGIMHYGRSE